MKEGWEIKKLGEVIEIRNGKNQQLVLSQTGKYPIMGSAGNVMGYANDFICEAGTTIIGRKGNISKPIFIDERFWNVDTAFGFYPKNEDVIDKRLIYYLCLGINFHSLNRGTTIPSLVKSELQTINISFPKSLPEQKRIVTILDETFAAIAKAKANAEQNLKNAKELFESYLQGVFEHPKGNWKQKRWGDLCDFVRGPFGGSLKKDIFKEDGFVVYEQKHAIHDHFNQLRYFIDENKFNEMIRFELKPGDIIMSCSGVTLGRVAIVPEGIKRGIINQALLKLTPKKNVSVHFIKHWLRSSIFQKIIFDFAGGAAIPNVPAAKILKDVLIPFPTLEEQLQVVNNIELMLTETKRLEIIYQTKINDLEELKKTVLQKAFSGELKMVDA